MTYTLPPPLSTGEFTEVKAHQGAITRLKVSWDESLIATTADDGSLFVWDVRDKDAKAAARREQERVDWAAEVLVTRRCV
jgi:WD40 repeat protein